MENYLIGHTALCVDTASGLWPVNSFLVLLKGLQVMLSQNRTFYGNTESHTEQNVF